MPINPPPAPFPERKNRKVIWVKLQYDEQLKRIPGTTAREESGPGALSVYDGLDLVARFMLGVENWWIESE